MTDRERVAKSRWFRAIDFGEFASQGRFPQGKSQNITLFGAMELLSAIDLNGKAISKEGYAVPAQGRGARWLPDSSADERAELDTRNWRFNLDSYGDEKRPLHIIEFSTEGADRD